MMFVVYAVIDFGEPHKWLMGTDEISVRGSPTTAS
jgi:hypothetical protein